MGHDDAAEQLTVQLSAYEAFKAMKKDDYAQVLLDYLGEKQSKKVLAKSKANKTRKKNKKAMQKQNKLEKELTLEK